MAKPELGVKRICLSCGAKFYDLENDPILCPACGAEFDPESAMKLKRGRTPANDDKPAKEAKKEKPAEEEDDLDVDLDDDDEDILEDTSDLDDDDDVPGVTPTESGSDDDN